MASAVDLIESNINDYRELEKYLKDNSQFSFLTTVQNFTLKSIILSIASYYESAIVNLIHESLETEKSELLKYFLQKTAFERKYHQLFSWDSNNINSFFSLFGPNFKNFAEKAVKADEAFAECIKAFLELGATRNSMVHSNFLTFNLEWTIEEVELKFHQSLEVLVKLPVLFSEYNKVKKLSEESG